MDLGFLFFFIILDFKVVFIRFPEQKRTHHKIPFDVTMRASPSRESEK
jgi:hypothetical protein